MIPREELHSMYWVHEMSLSEIAKEVGISHSTVFTWMKKYGIETRNVSESQLVGIFVPTKEELYDMYWVLMMSQSEIAEVYDVTQGTILNWMKKCKIESRTKSEIKHVNLSKPPKEKIYDMYLMQKMTLSEIAEEFGVSRSTINKWTKSYGIKTRTRSEASLNGKFTGEKSGGWKGGISFEPYCKRFNDSFKEAVRARDGYTCQLCGLDQNERRLSVHHIHYDKANCYPDVVALCDSCNSKVNGDRDYWEQFFENQLLERGLYCWSMN